jgi:hypothetical protein
MLTHYEYKDSEWANFAHVWETKTKWKVWVQANSVDGMISLPAYHVVYILKTKFMTAEEAANHALNLPSVINEVQGRYYGQRTVSEWKKYPDIQKKFASKVNTYLKNKYGENCIYESKQAQEEAIVILYSFLITRKFLLLT